MKERQSNIELLRIVSMFFIVLEHILINGTDFYSHAIGNQLLVANSIIGFTYIGVNCFILITGYFGAEFSWRRLISLYLICGFYELVGSVIAYAHGDVAWSTTAWSYIIFPLSHSNMWFIRCYVILLLLLPILNAGLKQLNQQQYIYALIALTVLNLYFGWFHKQADFNATGYTASQMVYLYVIGRYLGRYTDWDKIRKYRHYLLLSWLVLSILWGVLQNVHNTVCVVPHWNGWAYNNPVVLVSAILFLAIFRCIEIRPSKWINLFGGAMLGVFLIHMNRYVGTYIYNGVRSIIYIPILANTMWLQVLVLV